MIKVLPVIVPVAERLVNPVKDAAVVPKSISVPPIVTESFASWPFDTPPVFMLTAPEVTEKSPEANDATPLLLSVANSADIVAVPAL